MPKNAAGKAQLGTVWESGAPGPGWGVPVFLLASARREPLRSVRSSQSVPFCDNHKRQSRIYRLFQVLLLPCVPILLSHTQSLGSACPEGILCRWGPAWRR